MVPRELYGRPECIKAKHKELQLLEQFEVYEEAYEKDRNKDAELLSTTWVMTEKEVEGATVTKGQLCVQGYEETSDFRRLSYSDEGFINNGLYDRC